MLGGLPPHHGDQPKKLQQDNQDEQDSVSRDASIGSSDREVVILSVLPILSAVSFTYSNPVMKRSDSKVTLQVTGDLPLRHMETTGAIIGCAFEVINELGIGFVESVYKKALLVALRQRGLEARAEQSIQVRFRGESVGYFLADLLVEETVIVELKAVKAIAQGHHAQIINYLAASGIEVGLLLNFGGSKLEFKRFSCPSNGAPPRTRQPFSV